MNIEKRVEALIEHVRSGAMNEKELHNLYDNARSFDGASDEQLEPLIGAIESELRSRFPNKAKRIFGPKDDYARDYLGKLLDDVKNAFDLSENCVGSGIKTGGDMIAGRKHIDVYFSYKDQHGWHAGLAYLQDSAETAPYLRAKVYQRGESNGEGREIEDFAVEDRASAIEAHTRHLSQIGCRTLKNGRD